MADKVLQKAAALADVSKLSPFEGRRVIRTGIEIPNAAGGFQKAMMIDPQAFEIGEALDVTGLGSLANKSEAITKLLAEVDVPQLLAELVNDATT